jgi:photosystem II stability/assembly factor-like uncharacterized protein
MNDDPIVTLSRANPVPDWVTPAPINEVLTRIQEETGPATQRTARLQRFRPLQFVVPAVVVGVTLAVATAAVLLTHSPASRSTAASPHQTQSITVPRRTSVPTGPGMRGTVYIDGISLVSRSDAAVSLQQCTPCSGSGRRTRNYLATTRDAGRHWKVSRVPYNLQFPEFTNGKDGWAFGTSASREALYYVSHDGGVSWTPAQLDGGPSAYTTSPAVADGVVWAIGTSCATTCTYSVMRAAASQSTLSSTVAQPDPNAQTMTISAGSSQTAYATTTYDGGRKEWIYATHNAGRTWSKLSPPCRGDAPEAAGTDAVWEICPHRTTAISTDGGLHWQQHRSTRGTIAQLVPISATTAWATTSTSALLRTTDSGRSWQGFGEVLGAGKASPTAPGTFAPLSALDSHSAAAAYDYRTGKGTDIVVRTIGLQSPPSFITLPRGLGAP